MSDRSSLTNVCLLAALAFLVLSSGVVQCAYTCMEEDAAKRTSAHSAHAAHVTDCHLVFTEPQPVSTCPDRSCHQNQAPSRSLGGPELSTLAETSETLIGNPRLQHPTFRSSEPLPMQTIPEPSLLASWQPPATLSQTLLGVKTTVLLN